MARRPPNNDDMARGHARPRRRPCAECLTRKPQQRDGRAAEVEKQAAAAFDRLGQPEMAERHHAASRRQTELAEADSDEAARWS
jgi:hypothetical protein